MLCPPGQPQTNCLTAMDFKPEILSNLAVLNIQHLRSLEQGQDILAAHPRTDGGPPPHKKAREGEVATEKQVQAGLDKPARMNLREQSVAAFTDLKANKCDGLVIVCKQHPTALLTHLAR